MSSSHEDWVLFVGDGEVSNAQIDFLQQNRDSVKGLKAVKCLDPSNADLKACDSIPAFPAWCMQDKGKCSIGLRDSQELVSVSALEESL